MKYELFALRERRSILLCGTNYYPAPDMHPDRVLAEHDLLYVMEGEWSICQDEVNYVARKDDAMLLKAGAHHYSLTPCAPNTRTIFVHFAPMEKDQSDVEIPAKTLSDYSRGDVVCIPMLINCSQHRNVLRVMQGLVESYWGEREDKERYMGLQLDLLLSELAYVNRNQQGMGEEWLPGILHLMRTNPSKMYSLEELARQSDMSIRSFSSRFKQATGQTVHQYQLNLKLEMAFALVRSEPDRTLSDIAANFGFYDAYHFSRIFKSRYGFSPKHFRRSSRYPETKE